MVALTNKRWTEIRNMNPQEYSEDEYQTALDEVIEQHDHLIKQVKRLAKYIMQNHPYHKAWEIAGKQGNCGACDLAIAIMKDQSEALKRDDYAEANSFPVTISCRPEQSQAVIFTSTLHLHRSRGLGSYLLRRNHRV